METSYVVQDYKLIDIPENLIEVMNTFLKTETSIGQQQE